MIPRKVKVDEYLKNGIAWKRQKNMIYKWIFEILKIEKVKTLLSAVKKIGKRFVTKGTSNRKVGSGHLRASTIKLDHRLKMNILKGMRHSIEGVGNIRTAGQI